MFLSSIAYDLFLEKEGEEMVVTVNGKPKEISEGTSLKELVLGLGLKAERLVAEVNREILDRSCWEEYLLGAGDSIELISFVGGG